MSGANVHLQFSDTTPECAKFVYFKVQKMQQKKVGTENSTQYSAARDMADMAPGKAATQ
jgi:hypothetical protein